jgi:hypothetical protein
MITSEKGMPGQMNVARQAQIPLERVGGIRLAREAVIAVCQAH